MIIDIISRIFQAGIDAVKLVWEITTQVVQAMTTALYQLFHLATMSLTQTHTQVFYIVLFVVFASMEFTAAYVPTVNTFSPSSLLADLPTSQTVDVPKDAAIVAELKDIRVATLASYPIVPGGVFECASARFTDDAAKVAGSEYPYIWTLYTQASIPRTWDAPNGEVISEPQSLNDYYTWSACQVTLEANARVTDGSFVDYQPATGE